MNTAYALWPISILVILFYTLTFVFVRMGIIGKTTHRKFWNALLLITFLVTGLIGLLLVVKVNYKLEIPFYDELLRYHVEFGTGMAIIGFIHFWWHLSYYLKLFKGEPGHEPEQITSVENSIDERFLKIAAFLLGSTSVIAQVILLREFLSVFNGNELVIGIVLANWMVLTGFGAYLGKFQAKVRNASSFIFNGLLGLSVLPFITAFLINFLKNIVFPVGAMIGISQLFFASLLLLVPFCFVSGFLFTTIANSFSEIKNSNQSGSTYGFESVGSIAGGLLSGLLFIFIFSSIESLLVLIVLNGLVLFLTTQKQATSTRAWIPLLMVVLAFGILFFHPEKNIRSFIYPNQQIEVSKDSPYGNIVITRQENLWSVYNNNNLLFDSENFMLNEETVHFAMLQHPNPKNVLLVSGGLSGQLVELNKYKGIATDYIEENRWLLSILKDSLKRIISEQVVLHSTDPIRFLRKAGKKYDIAILNIPAPSTLQANRFYTIGFFTLLKSKMSEGGVLSLGLSAPVNYLNDEAVGVSSSIYATLKRAFKNVIIIPGEKNHFIASDARLTYAITEAVKGNGIENHYVNQFYIDDTNLKSRGENIIAVLNPAAEINSNLKPVSYRQQLDYWLSHFKGKFWLMAVIAGALSLILFFGGNQSSKTMFITGFTASGMEIILLFSLQIFFGNMYLLTSFVFAGFMLGLAVGAFAGNSQKIPAKLKKLSVCQILIGCFVVGAGLLLFSSPIAGLGSPVVYALFLTATVLMGILTGFQFTLASINCVGTFAMISGKTYSYDLIGSAVGALAVVIYLVPEIGITGSLLVVGSLNLLFGFWLILKRN